jgi:4-hydroxybenzoate polyprenyltransferase
MWTDGIPLPKENHEDILRACKCSYLIIFLMTYPAWITSMRLFLYVLSFSVLIWVYSAPLLWGKSEFRRLKEQPLLDSLSNGLICWLFWACGYIFTGDTPPNAELWSSFGWLIFFFASALHSLAAMVDVRGDLYAGHRTIAVGYGERLAATFSAICL